MSINARYTTVAALMLLWIASGLFTVATSDSVRDIYQAFMIAQHGALPLTGPQLAFSIHQGPLWFYLLAIPAWLFDHWGAIAIYVFILGSLKFPLAFMLGSRLHSPQLGLALALFLALPGWTSYQLIIWTSTSVLETALLLYLLSLQAVYRTGSNPRWFVCGVCLCLAAHAHPTALPFAALALLPMLRQRKHFLHYALAFGAGAVSLYLPYVIDQLLSGLPDLAAARQYQQSEFDPGGTHSFSRLVGAITFFGPRLFYETALPAPLSGLAITLHSVIVMALLGLAALGWRTASAQLRAFVLLSAAMLLLELLFVVFIRARTPNHFAYAPTFALMLLYGSLAIIAIEGWPRLALLRPLGFAILTLFLVSSTGVAVKRYTHSIVFQENVLFDVKALAGDWQLSGVEIPAMHARRHGRFLCESGPVVFHGPYAAMVDAHVALEADMLCGKREHIRIGGVTETPGFSHLAGIAFSQHRHLHRKADKVVGNIYFHTPISVSKRTTALPLASGDRNPPRGLFRDGNTAIQTLELASNRPAALLVSKPVGYFMTLSVEAASCNGEPAQLVHRYNYSWLYRCADTDANSMRWRVDYVTSADNLVDAVLLPTGSNPPPN